MASKSSTTSSHKTNVELISVTFWPRGIHSTVEPLSGRVGLKVKLRKAKFEGSVLASDFPGRWMVWWDDISKCSLHTSEELTFIEAKPPPWSAVMTQDGVFDWRQTRFISNPATALDKHPPTPLVVMQQVRQQSWTQQEPSATTMTDEPSSLSQTQQSSTVSDIIAGHASAEENDSQPDNNNSIIADVCNPDSVILCVDNTNQHPQVTCPPC